jgi:RimK family alpha-L-glutamate ligase
MRIAELAARRPLPAPTAYIVGDPASETNERLRAALAGTGTLGAVGSAELAAATARRGDIVFGRLDVRPTLDGVQPGLGRLAQLARRGVRVVNGADTLVATHDKLTTMLMLRAASIPQPRAIHLSRTDEAPPFRPPYVVKPRYGSWGLDIHLCTSREELRACLGLLRERPWFRRRGALVQELIPPQGYDLRLIVAGGEVVGAIERVAAPGEWRTNIALGGTRRRTTPTPDACAIALRAAAAVAGDLVGVDLAPCESGWRVIEINGAVDFTDDYALDERDVFTRATEPFAPSRPREALVAVAPVELVAGAPA